MTNIEKLAYEYCRNTPEWGQIVVRDGEKGILFTGPDRDDPNGDFIPFSDLGYNSTFGFFKKSDFPNQESI